MWLGEVPWAGRHWALPVLTVLAPSSRYYQQHELAASEGVAIVQIPDADAAPQRPNNPPMAE